MDSVLVAIEAKRKSLSVSQESLATVAGLTQRQYRRYLTGCAQPRRSTILRLQNTLCLLERMGERALNPHTITYLVAIVCAALGHPFVAVMSEGNSIERARMMRALGAEVVLVDGIAAALPMLDRIEAEEGRRILHPFNDMNMAYGAATCGAEMVEDMPPLDMVVLPVGGGGLIAGMAAAIRKMSPDTLIIGVEPEGANSLSRSFASGRPETLESINTIADSLGAPMALAESMALARENVDELITIPDSLMADTMLLMSHTLNIIAEPACTASLGSVLGPLRERAAGKRVGVLACGSNIGPERFEAYTSGARMPMPPV